MLLSHQKTDYKEKGSISHHKNMTIRFHSGVQLPLVIMPPLANYIKPYESFGQSRMSVIFRFFQVPPDTFSHQGFKILPIAWKIVYVIKYSQHFIVLYAYPLPKPTRFHLL